VQAPGAWIVDEEKDARGQILRKRYMHSALYVAASRQSRAELWRCAADRVALRKSYIVGHVSCVVESLLVASNNISNSAFPNRINFYKRLKAL